MAACAQDRKLAYNHEQDEEVAPREGVIATRGHVNPNGINRGKLDVVPTLGWYTHVIKQRRALRPPCAHRAPVVLWNRAMKASPTLSKFCGIVRAHVPFNQSHTACDVSSV
jgi:hypothetical protein